MIQAHPWPEMLESGRHHRTAAKLSSVESESRILPLTLINPTLWSRSRWQQPRAMELAALLKPFQQEVCAPHV